MARAVILLGTLKKDEPSNTQVLCEFLMEHMRAQEVEPELIRLVEHRILPGTRFDMGEGDEWPHILKKIEAADMVVFATPVWWGVHSSQTQQAIERLDEVHDEVLEGKTSRLYGKAAGIVVTGDSDGAEHIIACLANFFNAVGMVLPPYATLTVLSHKQGKGENTSRDELLAMYREEYADTARGMVEELKRYAGR